MSISDPLFNAARNAGMISCKRATELVSQSVDRPLGAGERWSLRLHMLLCGLCRAYRRQVVQLDAVLRAQSAHRPDLAARVGMDSAMKERLKRAIRDQQA